MKKTLFSTLLLAALLAVVTLVPGCSSKKKVDINTPPNEKMLVIGVEANFEEKWNPFLAESAYDRQIIDQVFSSILMLDDSGAYVPYAGDITFKDDGDGTGTYTVSLNKGMYFHNGEEITIDDYIYFLKVTADPSSTGPGQLITLPIEGVLEYYYDDANYQEKLNSIDAEVQAKYSEGAISLEDFSTYAHDTDLEWYDWDLPGDVGNGWTWVEYIENMGYEADAAAIDQNDPEAVFNLFIKVEYETALEAYYSDDIETHPDAWFSAKLKKEFALNNVAGGSADVKEISGVKKVDKYTCTVKFTSIDIYGNRGINAYLVPRSYYGELTKGDVSAIEANMEPLGSGPYVFKSYEDNIATCYGFKEFFLGTPKTGIVRWQYVPQSDTVGSLQSAAIDIAEPTMTKSNMDVLGADDNIRIDLVDNAGYGYMAMNCERVPLNVRKGVWCLMNRQPSVEAYYQDRAKVIERPMTTTLMEYPQDATQYYPYSKDEALKYFEAAGYTQKDGKLVNAKGEQLVLNVYIGGNGNGEHPAFNMLVQAEADMRSLGGEIQIQDVPFNVLQGAMNDGTADAWIMAWGAVYDCDKRDQFKTGGGQNRYRFSDSRMDDLLDRIVQTVDLTARRALVAEMLDLAMDQCIEFPLYQRKNMKAYNTSVVISDSIHVATTTNDYTNSLYLVDVYE